jgi:hypothetical protein
MYLQLVLEAERVERVELRFLHPRTHPLIFKPLFKKFKKKRDVSR